jgi:hypothetical protein
MSNSRRMAGGLFQGMNKKDKLNPLTATKDAEKIIKEVEESTSIEKVIEGKEVIQASELVEPKEPVQNKVEKPQTQTSSIEKTSKMNVTSEREVPKWKRRNNVGIRLEKDAIKNLTFWAKEVTMSRDEGEERITTSSFISVLINILNDSEKYLDLNHVSSEKDLEDRVKQAFKLQFNR